MDEGPDSDLAVLAPVRTENVAARPDLLMGMLTDIGESLGPLNHGDVVTAVLGPFVSEASVLHEEWTPPS